MPLMRLRCGRWTWQILIFILNGASCHTANANLAYLQSKLGSRGFWLKEVWFGSFILRHARPASDLAFSLRPGSSCCLLRSHAAQTVGLSRLEPACAPPTLGGVGGGLSAPAGSCSSHRRSSGEDEEDGAALWVRVRWALKLDERPPSPRPSAAAAAVEGRCWGPGRRCLLHRRRLGGMLLFKVIICCYSKTYRHDWSKDVISFSSVTCRST